jgi:phosphatidylglycerol:prolipoprotein diacylglycerol transferase
VHPVAFELGSFSVHWYGILLAAGFLAGAWTASRRAPLDGLNPEKVIELIPWLLIGGLLGARLLYVVTYWGDEFAGKSILQILNLRSGLVFYGGLIGAVLSCIVAINLKKLPHWKTGDVMAPSIALGHMFGRIGCFFTGCCHGTVCDLPWAIRFPPEHATGGQPVHPTQFYEAGLNLLLYAGLEWLYRRKKFDGQVFATYLIAYGFLRAFTDAFRGDYAEKWFDLLTPGQAASVIMVIAGVTMYVVVPRFTMKHTQAHAA